MGSNPFCLWLILLLSAHFRFGPTRAGPLIFRPKPNRAGCFFLFLPRALARLCCSFPVSAHEAHFLGPVHSFFFLAEPYPNSLGLPRFFLLHVVVFLQDSTEPCPCSSRDSAVGSIFNSPLPSLYKGAPLYQNMCIIHLHRNPKKLVPVSPLSRRNH